MQLSYHVNFNEVQELALLDTPQAQGPFDRLAWFRALAEEGGMAPLLAVARHGEAWVVWPLSPAPEGLRALANWYAFTVRPVWQGEALPLLTALARDLKRRVSRITLAPVPDEGGEASLLVDALRSTLKRKGRKVSITLHDSFSAAAWADYEAVYAQSWKPAEGSPAMLRRFAAGEGEAGRLRLGLACAAGTPVAAQLWTVEGGTAYVHKLAYTWAARSLSPGTILSAAMFERAIDTDNVDLIDFGTGNDPYKRDWMEQVRPRYHIAAHNPASLREWRFIAKAMIRSRARRQET